MGNPCRRLKDSFFVWVILLGKLLLLQELPYEKKS